MIVEVGLIQDPCPLRQNHVIIHSENLTYKHIFSAHTESAVIPVWSTHEKFVDKNQNQNEPTLPAFIFPFGDVSFMDENFPAKHGFPGFSSDFWVFQSRCSPFKF
jgi:hypothetical protein